MQKQQRERTIETFLHYRTTGELNAANWSRILDGACELVLPVTPYRSFPPYQVQDAQRHIRGIQAIIQDTASLHTLYHSVARPNAAHKPVQARFYALAEETIMSGDTIMCHWYMRTENAVERGARFEFTKHGFMKAHFAAPSSRLTFVELSFDVMGFMQQLRRATGSPEFAVVPNNLALSSEPTHLPRMVCTVAEPRQTIVRVNPVRPAPRPCLLSPSCFPSISLSLFIPVSLPLLLRSPPTHPSPHSTPYPRPGARSSALTPATTRASP